MVNSDLLQSVAFDSPDDWEAFDLIHGQMHQTAYLAMLRADKPPMFYPMFGFPRRDNQEYLLDHWTVHQSMARLLGLTGVPDLSVVNLEDREQYENWLQLHAAVHAAENKALSIQ